MKIYRKQISLLLFFICLSVQYSEAQTWNDFFNYDNNKAFKAICFAAHPTNTYKYGSYSVSGNEITVTIHASGWVMDDICTEVKLYYDSDNYRFTNLTILSDDDIVPAFNAIDTFRSWVFNDIKDYDTIRTLESLFGEDLKNLNARRLCTAYMTYILWKL